MSTFYIIRIPIRYSDGLAFSHAHLRGWRMLGSMLRPQRPRADDNDEDDDDTIVISLLFTIHTRCLF